MSNNNTSESVPRRTAENPFPTRTEENAVAILDRLAKGESLVSITESEGMPSYPSVARWLEADETFRERYTRAREEQANYLADEILEIADNAENDSTVDKDGNPIVDHENIQRSRLRVDARKWVAAKLLPRKYGDRPAEVHVNTSVNNFHVDSSRLNQLQERRSKQLERVQVRALPEKTV